VTTYPSRLFEQAVSEFSRLPGIGRKTAVRMVLHLLREPTIVAETFGNAVIRLRNEIRYCSICNNITENEVCSICDSSRGKSGQICVVEDLRDVIAIENTGQYNGLYHVLGGVISPMDGIGPADLNIEMLLKRAADSSCNEIILALPATVEGDTTGFYLFRKLKDFHANISVIARGISFGEELEYTDELTLGRSILNRRPYEATVQAGR
jgi:recombination protein RecR